MSIDNIKQISGNYRSFPDSPSIPYQNQKYVLSEKRIQAMRDGDLDTLLHMGLWDKIKDIFRTHKKHEVLNLLAGVCTRHHILNNPFNYLSWSDRMDLITRARNDFESLKDYLESDYDVRKFKVVTEGVKVHMSIDGNILFAYKDYDTMMDNYEHLLADCQVIRDELVCIKDNIKFYQNECVKLKDQLSAQRIAANHLNDEKDMDCDSNTNSKDSEVVTDNEDLEVVTDYEFEF